MHSDMQSYNIDSITSTFMTEKYIVEINHTQLKIDQQLKPTIYCLLIQMFLAIFKSSFVQTYVPTIFVTFREIDSISKWTISISNEHKNGANASFSVKSKIFPKLKAQILQMRNQNVQESLGFTVERKKIKKKINLSLCFHQSKIVTFFDFLVHKLNLLFCILNHRNFHFFLLLYSLKSHLSKMV